MNQVVILLQNPWSKHYAGRVWPREYWLMALKASRSGQRLRVLEQAAGSSLVFWYDNANPIVGATPDSCYAPDLAHIEEVLNQLRPRYVVACGKQAEQGLAKVWNKNALIVPHPAHRLLTNELYIKAGGFLRNGFEGVIRLRQGNGLVIQE